MQKIGKRKMHLHEITFALNCIFKIQKSVKPKVSQGHMHCMAQTADI